MNHRPMKSWFHRSSSFALSLLPIFWCCSLMCITDSCVLFTFQLFPFEIVFPTSLSNVLRYEECNMEKSWARDQEWPTIYRLKNQYKDLNEAVVGPLKFNDIMKYTWTICSPMASYSPHELVYYWHHEIHRWHSALTFSLTRTRPATVRSLSNHVFQIPPP